MNLYVVAVINDKQAYYSNIFILVMKNKCMIIVARLFHFYLDLFYLFRIHNKGFYFKMGLQKMVKKRLVKDLHRHIRLEVDGRLVELPPVEGIIILNILR